MQSYSYSLRENAFLYSILQQFGATAQFQRQCILSALDARVLQHRDGASCLSYLHCTAYSIAVRQWVICHIFYSPTVQLRESSFYASYGLVLQYSSETGEFCASQGTVIQQFRLHIVKFYSTVLRQWVLCSIRYSLTVQFRDSAYSTAQRHVNLVLHMVQCYRSVQRQCVLGFIQYGSTVQL